uniref:PH domain-containing protein n=1 Tax=Lotharella oceanica TaxID=641309 RepID=A0A7S2TZ79_9EUKA|mmetsp:Transcript_36640/g.67694  ORF Transcript_36640/g.67694 Transcript_36640/m.67694 type:complete len:328 (+) Transcript_36640:183-1166(+)|eukprot:CAMPEP_0170182012 /NCGR_PEP_ID=MMETSP0040_2-20121228/26672_1 /TAXON_ID=641309 /ORGANISM="Lotharella oceanica, Strain CCMP622" /LENGTH=327 /DNA_ID=CAMNT_0010427265 /DNA_START=131 /DNA_END=1114 /DNA_ORIENTATION=-
MLNLFKGAAEKQAQLQKDERLCKNVIRYRKYAEKERNKATAAGAKGDMSSARTHTEQAERYDGYAKDELAKVSPVGATTYMAKLMKEWEEEKRREAEKNQKEHKGREKEEDAVFRAPVDTPDANGVMKIEFTESVQSIETSTSGKNPIPNDSVRMLKIIVPQGVSEGEAFKATFQDQDMIILVPKGSKPGSEILIPAQVEVVTDEVTMVNVRKSIIEKKKGSLTKEGWLEKTGYYNKNFQRRYFRLKEDKRLYYYKDRTSEKPNGEVDLTTTVLDPDPPSDGTDYFVLIIDNGKKTKREMKVRCESPAEKKDWIETLSRVPVRGKFV